MKNWWQVVVTLGLMALATSSQALQYTIMLEDNEYAILTDPDGEAEVTGNMSLVTSNPVETYKVEVFNATTDELLTTVRITGKSIEEIRHG